MIRKLQHWFALSEEGAKGMVSGVFWCTLCNLSLMAPVGLLFLVLRAMIAALRGGPGRSGADLLGPPHRIQAYLPEHL